MSTSYYIIFEAYVASLVWTYLKSMKQVETLFEFSTGGHRMVLLLRIGTTVATWVSVASVTGVPGFLYRTGVVDAGRSPGIAPSVRTNGAGRSPVCR